MARCTGCGSAKSTRRPMFDDPLDRSPVSSVTLCDRCFERESPGKFEICGECGRLVTQYPGHFMLVDDDLVCSACSIAGLHGKK